MINILVILIFVGVVRSITNKDKVRIYKELREDRESFKEVISCLEK